MFFGKVKFVKIFAKYNHQAAIDHLGRLWTWGDNSERCLGHDTKEDPIHPLQLEALNHKKIIDVGIGDKFLVVLTLNRNDKFESQESQNFRSYQYKKAQQNQKVKRREF